MSQAFPEREPDQLAGVPLPEYRRAVIGHEAAMAGFEARLAAGRLPGGVLIHGPRGIGKATFAFELARRIFTATGDETPGHIAEQVASGGYPNLFVLRRALKDTGKGFYTVIRVDEVRSYIEELRMTRGRAGHRIAVIDAIDDCNPSAANALLKILEEPPPDTTFLLVSHQPGGLLPTIRSRCIQVALRPVGPDAVRAVLADAGQSEAVEAAAELADGRPRRGYEALTLGDAAALAALRDWLADPLRVRAGERLALAETLGADRDGAELRFARDLVFDWIAGEARAAALAASPRRLASASALWEKARLSLADADTYNLDMRQTLVSLFDAIHGHVQLSAA